MNLKVSLMLFLYMVGAGKYIRQDLESHGVN
jgi:hypothetical protein